MAHSVQQTNEWPCSDEFKKVTEYTVWADEEWRMPDGSEFQTATIKPQEANVVCEHKEQSLPPEKNNVQVRYIPHASLHRW